MALNQLLLAHMLLADSTGNLCDTLTKAQYRCSLTFPGTGELAQPAQLPLTEVHK